MNIRVGFDPEVFFTDMRGRLLLPNIFTPGTKGHPVYSGDGIVGTLCDGVAVEVNTSRTASTASEFVDLVEHTLETLNSMCTPGVQISHDYKALVPQEYYKTKAYKEIGCEPDYCVYRRRMVRPAQPRQLQGYRYAGGHLHISTDLSPPLDRHVWAKMLDIFLAPLLVDDGPQRRSYISAGRIREKGTNYIEYRVPSNAWLWMDSGSLYELFNDIEDATACAWKHDEESLAKYESVVNAAINHNDVPASELLIHAREMGWV